MLSLLQIQRMINQRQFRQLVDRILANGRCDDRRVTQRLQQPQNVVPAALALALQRVVELTYRPTAVAEALACRLLDQQRGDGLFGPGRQNCNEGNHDADCTEAGSFETYGDHADGDDLASTALAVRAMSEFARQQQLAGDRVARRIELALDRALAALTLRQALERQLGCDAIDRAIVAWQLHSVIGSGVSNTSESTAADDLQSRRTRAA